MVFHPIRRRMIQSLVYGYLSHVIHVSQPNGQATHNYRYYDVKTTSLCRIDVVMTLLLRRVSTGNISTCLNPFTNFQDQDMVLLRADAIDF